jgi:hypothetical protein
MEVTANQPDPDEQDQRLTEDALDGAGFEISRGQ